jgi:hypothetical protein
MTQKILNILKVVVFLLPVAGIEAQVTNAYADVGVYAEKKHKINRHGMIVLTSWASVNIISGTGYFISGSKREQYLYAMNAAWGAVNLAIALPGLVSKKKSYNSKNELLKDQLKTEKVFIINAALDLVYIGGGFVLNEVSKNQLDRNHSVMLAGFGDSFMVQGAGLLVFDTAMWLLNKNHRKKQLVPILENTQISLNGRGIKLSCHF